MYALPRRRVREWFCCLRASSQKMASTLEGKKMVDTMKVGREGGRDETVLRSLNRFVCERVLLLLLLPRVVLKALKLIASGHRHKQMRRRRGGRDMG